MLNATYNLACPGPCNRCGVTSLGPGDCDTCLSPLPARGHGTYRLKPPRAKRRVPGPAPREMPEPTPEMAQLLAGLAVVSRRRAS